MKHVHRHLHRESSHNFIFFVFLLYVFVATIFTVYVGNKLTTRTMTTQSQAGAPTSYTHTIDGKEFSCKLYDCGQNLNPAGCNDETDSKGNSLCHFNLIPPKCKAKNIPEKGIYRTTPYGAQLTIFDCVPKQQIQPPSCSQNGTQCCDDQAPCLSGNKCRCFTGTCQSNGICEAKTDSGQPAQQGRCQQDNIGLKCDGGYESGRCPGDAHFRFCRSGWDPNQGVGSQYSGSQQAPGTQNPPAQNPPSGNQGNDAIGRHCSVNNQGGTCQFTSSCNGQSYPASQAPGNGCHIDPRADVQCCIQSQNNQPPAPQQSAQPAPQQPQPVAPTCPSFTRPTTIYRQEVSPGVQSITIPTTYDASKIKRYEIRVDDLSNPWDATLDGSNQCTARHEFDECNNFVSGNQYTYRGGAANRGFQAGRTYNVWYHIVNTCDQASEAQFISVVVKAETPNNPLDIKVSKVPGDIPAVCTGTDTISPFKSQQTIQPGNYTLELPQIPDSIKNKYPGISYSLIIDDLSNGTMADCSQAASGDKCIKNVSPGTIGPFTFLANRTYDVIYFATAQCGRIGSISTKALTVSP